jgi:large subunit ribosomal protein L25
MAEVFVLDGEARTKLGSNTSKQVRKKGLIPAVMYGHGEVTMSMAISSEALQKAIKHGVRIFDVKVGDATQKTLLKSVQWHPMGHDILHADFYRVSADETITLEVRVELRGTAPGVTAGGALNQQIHSLTVECLVIAIPESIRVYIGELQLDQAIHVSDLKLPEGVKVMNDPEAVIVQVTAKVEEEEAAATGEAAEPEVIGRTKEEEEEEAKK